MEVVAASNDWIVSASADHTARIWDGQTGREVRSVTTPDEVWNVAVSSDGSLMATATRGGAVQLWSVPDGEPMGDPFVPHGGTPVAALEFNPDGRLLVSGGFDGAVRLWEVATRRPAPQVMPRHDGQVIGVAISSDGRYIASVSYVNNFEDTSSRSSQLRVTELDTGRPIVDVTESGYGALSVAMSPDGKRLAVGADDQTIRVHDAETGALVGKPITGRSGRASVVAYAAAGTRIVSNGGSALHEWSADPDRSTGKSLDIFALFGPTAVSPDGKIMATRDEDESNIALWNVDSGARIRTITTGHSGHVTALAWRPDGQAIASSGDGDKSVRIWSTESGARIGSPLDGPASRTIVLTFSADSNRIVAGTLDGSAWLWDLAQDPARRQQLTGNVGAVTIAGFSADGRRVLAGAQSHFESGDSTALEKTTNAFTSPEVFTASSVQVWNADTGELAGPPVTGGAGRASEVAFAKDHLPIAAAAISPDGQRILIGTPKGLQWYDVASGQPNGEPWVAPEQTLVTTVAISPDGGYAASADSLSANIQLWDAHTGRPVGRPLEGHSTRILRIAFGADGRNILSWGDLNLWMIWPAPSGWADELCTKVATDMTETEWDAWVSPEFDFQKPCP